LVGNFGQANYMAAKFGIVGLSRGIALDMQRFNVRSNCIAPFAWTRMIDSIPTETAEEKARVERMQQMTPEKIAPLAVYLASDRAEGISGQIFGVRNNEIFLFNQPRAVRTLHRSDGWTPDKIAEQLKGALGPSFTPLERSSDVFSGIRYDAPAGLLPGRVRAARVFERAEFAAGWNRGRQGGLKMAEAEPTAAGEDLAQNPRVCARAVRQVSGRVLARARPRARLSDRVRRSPDRGRLPRRADPGRSTAAAGSA
jgi:hypothetical protein